jgi:flavodoxin
MGINIYYFSGTGNSLAVARDIADRINGNLIAIQSVIDTDIIKIQSEVIGIVFPVYNQGIPFIIKRFIDKIESVSGKYIFAVCTHGGSPGICLKYLNNMIKKKGGKLSAGFSVKMPYNYVTPSFTIKKFYRSFKLQVITPELQQQLFDDWKNKLEEVCSNIIIRREGNIETKADVIEFIVDFLNLRETVQKYCWLKIGGFEGKTELSFMESIQLLDNGFNCDANCKSCGICSKICPVMNIIMVNGFPKWQHKCEQCFACLHWCPKEAIQFSSKTSGQNRYHHPNVNISDMICNKNVMFIKE